MRVKNIIARRTFSIVKVLYFIFGMCIALPLFIVLTTEGSIKEMLVASWEFSLVLFRGENKQGVRFLLLYLVVAPGV